jgi:hypothetical protein
MNDMPLFFPAYSMSIKKISGLLMTAIPTYLTNIYTICSRGRQETLRTGLPSMPEWEAELVYVLNITF